MRLTKKLGAVAFAFMTLSSVNFAHAQGTGSPILVTNGREIAAFFDGPQCAVEVQLALRARSYEHFSSSEPIAARLMNNVTNIVRRQCASTERVLAEGYVSGDLSYTGIAAQETDWRIVEVGTGGSGLIGAGERSDRGGKSTFSAKDGFVSGGKFLEGPAAGKVLCESYHPETHSCRVLTKFHTLPDGELEMRVRQLEDEDGMEARVTSTVAENPEGFLCSNPLNANVEVVGGAMGDASRAALADSLKARIEDVGTEACIGYASDGTTFTSSTFDSDDLSLSEDAIITLFEVEPSLRYDN